MKKFSLFLSFALITLVSSAKIWRLNNTVGVVADFTTFHAAVQSSSVLAGDTIYVEPSYTTYTTNSITVTKRLVVIGMGFFHDTTNTSYPVNPGLQYSKAKTQFAYFKLGNGANGSVYAGLVIDGLVLTGSATPFNLTIDRNLFNGELNIESGSNDNIVVKKNFFNGQAFRCNTAGATMSNLTCENNIFFSTFGRFELTQLTGSNNVVRNNSVYQGGYPYNIQNAYVANNIFGTNSNGTFTNSTIKNNVFAVNQALPGTATNNLVSVDMNTVYVNGTTGSIDSRVVLKAGSPAIGAGLTVGAVVSPDCGAFGATDPYKLSGLPAIPSIYSLSAPISIPSGTTSMNVTFSVKNNN